MITTACSKQLLPTSILDIKCFNQLSDTGNARVSLLHMQRRFKIILVIQGGGEHIINKQHHPLHDNAVYAALPGQAHQMITDPNARGYILSFNMTCIQNETIDYTIAQDSTVLQSFFSLRPKLLLLPELTDDLVWIIRRLMAEMYHEDELQPDITNKYIKLLLLYLRRQIEKETTQLTIHRGSLLFRDFLLLLENNFMEKRSVEAYAQELCISSKHLTTVVKKESGFPPLYHIHQRMVLEAKRKIKESGASLKEIAWLLGYGDIAHFSRLFKKIAGDNFTDYKRRLCIGVFPINPGADIWD